MSMNLRTDIIAIILFIMLLCPTLLSLTPGVSAQDPNNTSFDSNKSETLEIPLSNNDTPGNASLSVDKGTYVLNETVFISLTAPPDAIIFFNITSPAGILFTALVSKKNEYQFRPDITGTYVIDILLRIGDDEKSIATEFVVIDKIINTSDLIPPDGFDLNETETLEILLSNNYTLDNALLLVDKAMYVLNETVCISLTAPPETIVNFIMTNPEGIIYSAVPSTDGKYQFKLDITGTYMIDVLLCNENDEKTLTTEFEVISSDPEVTFLEPEQEEIVVGEPVNWSMYISITNFEDYPISNFFVTIPLPAEYSNLSCSAGFKIINSSVIVNLAPVEELSFNISYQTSPAQVEVIEKSIDISDLIPPEAFDVDVYKQIDSKEEKLKLSTVISVKHVKVWHNSSVHYHDIPVAIDAQGSEQIVELADDMRIVNAITVERSNETALWTIPELSNKTYAIFEGGRDQGEAHINEPVEWQLNVSGILVTYKTPAPYKTENEPVIADGMWKKEIVISSNVSVHYSNVTAYSTLDEIEKSNLRLYWLVNGSRIDVTGFEEFNVSFSDNNGNGILDKVIWNVPQLSNQSFEIKANITVINVQSYPTVGGNWGVEFETVGCANLTITAVDETTWSNSDEDGDLLFLEIKCGDQTLDYGWINDSVFIQNYSCDESGYETSKVLTSGKHALEFRFGGDVDYAYNQAGYPNCTVVSVTPGDLKANSTGTFTALINCTDPAGINLSRFLVTRTVEGGDHPGLPNLWSIRPPVNDHAQSHSCPTHGNIPQILLADSRGMGKWYDSGIFAENYSYAVSAYYGPLINPYVTVTNGSTWALFNLTWKVEPVAFRSSSFLSRGYMEKEAKDEYSVYANNPLLVKFWDLEHIRGTANYTVCMFKNINYSATPNQLLSVYYCNDSYRTVSEEMPGNGASDDTVNMTGNVLLMHLNEASGTVVDYSGEGNNGTAYDLTRNANGKFDKCFDYTGLDSRVVVPYDNSLALNDTFSFSAWVKLDTTEQRYGAIIHYGADNSWNDEVISLQFYPNRRSTLKFAIFNPPGSAPYTDVDSTIALAANKWYHIAATFDYDAREMILYIDGAENNRNTNANRLPAQVNSDIVIGAQMDDISSWRGYTYRRYGLLGDLDEVAVWNRTLSATEVRDIYNRGVKKASEDTDNCVQLDAFGTADLDDIYYASRNSSYLKSCFSVNTSHFGGINATDTFFIAYESGTTTGNYRVRYANGSSGTNVSFADSKVAWTSTNDAVDWTQAQFTPDLWFSTIKQGDQFKLGVYAENNTGGNYTNFSLYTDDIGDVNYPISKSDIAYYESVGGSKNYYLNGSYAGNMTINVNMAKDPDAPGTVNHSLYLYNPGGTLNTTINASFNSSDDSNVNVIFNTSTVADAQYRMNVTAVADDDSSDVESYLTTVNFTVDNTAPNTTLYSPAPNYFNNASEPVDVTFVCNATDTSGLDRISLYITDATNQSFSLNQTTDASGTQASANWTLSLANGDYTWNCLAYDAAGNSDWGDSNRTVKINHSGPDIRVINVTFDYWDTGDARSSVSETGTGYHVKEGKNITINVTIANYGVVNVTSDFNVSYFDSAGVYGNWSRCFWNSTYNVSTEGELGGATIGYPHNTTYITGYWDPSFVGTHNISVWADPANSASESAANTTNNNASAGINVSAWQKYYGNVSGGIALADSTSESLYDWAWSNETDIGYAYIVKNGASVNWSALHALGCDSDDNLNASGLDFLDADTNLNMVVGSNNATGFADNNITELFSGGDPGNATNTTSFTVYGTSIPNVPIVNSTDMTIHMSVGSANFVTGILWDATLDTNGYYDTTDDETLVFVTKIRVAAAGIGSYVHNYEFAAPCMLNPVAGGDLDIYMELK